MEIDWKNKLKEYDVFDVISKISCLNLLPQNQNKDFVFDEIIDSILQMDLYYFYGNNEVSKNKISQIANDILAKNSMLLDPIEYPFIQRVQFYGDRWVFNGRNADGAYRLQMLINAIFLYHNDFDDEYKSIVSKMLEIVLQISNNIATRLNYDINTLKKYDRNDIVYPDSNLYRKLVSAITFDLDDYNTLIEDRYFAEMFSEFGCKASDSPENYYFYYHPFIKISSNKFICLNPTMISFFAISFILRLSETYGLQKDVYAAYNGAVFLDCRKSLSILNHKKIKETALDIELINDSEHKEMLLSGGNDGLIFLMLVSNDGIEGAKKDIDESKVCDAEYIERRIEYIRSKLSNIIDKQRLYFITILSFLDKGIGLGLNSYPQKYICINPFQLQCVAINERSNKNFLLHYMEAKANISFAPSLFTNDYNVISYFVYNDYSFYINDNINPRNAFLMFDLGDALEYTIKALKKEDWQLIEYPGNLFLKEVVIHDSIRNIYCPIAHGSIELVILLSNITIWISSIGVSSEKIININYSIVDLLSYWIGELKSIIENNSYQSNRILIMNELEGEIDKYYDPSLINDLPLSVLLDISLIDNHTIIIDWTPEAYINLCYRLNNGEKELISIVMDRINILSCNNLSNSDIEHYFDDPLKHRMIITNYMMYPYLKPINGHYNKIPKETMDKVLDEIGDYFVKSGNNIGEINTSDNSQICNEIVDFLFKQLKMEICKYRIDNLIKIVYYDLEIVIYNLMSFQINYATMLACYPEKKRQYEEDFNNLNQSSMALKFLIEYIGSIKTEGDKQIGELDYEYLLSLCMQIIDWAHTSDLFRYGIINEKIHLLKSGRIGFAKKRANYLSNKSWSMHNKRLIFTSDPSIEVYNHNKALMDVLTDLDAAYIEEYGYSFSDYKKCIMEMIDIGENIQSEVKQYNKSDLIDVLVSKCNLTSDTISNIIKNNTILIREDYLSVPLPYKVGDVYPWRNNRRLSFVRRPLIYFNNIIIWGNRQLYHSYRFTMDLISNGKFEASSNRMKKMVSKIANITGNDFNDEVAKRIKSLGYDKEYCKVKKINKKKIVDENKNSLGDIDVLLINEAKRKIIVIEVKDFSYSRTPYEINREYMNIFCDSEGKLCYISKHKKRVDWVKKHIDDLIMHYHLSDDHWKVDDVLVVNEPITSNSYYHNKQKILIYSELDSRAINRI